MKGTEIWGKGRDRMREGKKMEEKRERRKRDGRGDERC
jgi:hypothetical protein